MLLMPDDNKNNVVDVEKIKNIVVQVGHGAKHVILPAWSPIEYEIFSINFYQTPVRSLPCLVSHCTESFSFCSFLDLIDVTLAFEDSCNLSLSYQL